MPPVVPITNFVKGSELHRALSGYKASPAPRLRAARAALLQELLCGFLASHAACLLRPPPDSNLGPHLVVPVPSSTPDRPRRKGHPLVVLLDAVLSSLKESEDGPAARLVLADCLEARSPAAGRLRARRGAFGVKEGAGLVARGALAIVIDDVFTSGSRALSAAAALEDAGMLVRAVVPIGRLVRPEHNPATAAFWAVHAAGAEDIACCRLCKTASALSVRRGEVSSRVAA